MKHTRRIICATLAATLLLGGCGGSKKTKSPKESPSASMTEQKPSQSEKSQTASPGADSQKQVQIAEESQAAPEDGKSNEQPAKKAIPQSGGIRPEFKEAVDSYVAFYEEYADFMKRYMANPANLGLLMEMSSWLEKVNTMDEKLEAFDDEQGTWTPEETKYWTDAYVYITGLLLSFASSAS